MAETLLQATCVNAVHVSTSLSKRTSPIPHRTSRTKAPLHTREHEATCCMWTNQAISPCKDEKRYRSVKVSAAVSVTSKATKGVLVTHSMHRMPLRIYQNHGVGVLGA
jgi:hypothetical protein